MRVCSLLALLLLTAQFSARASAWVGDEASHQAQAGPTAPPPAPKSSSDNTCRVLLPQPVATSLPAAAAAGVAAKNDNAVAHAATASPCRAAASPPPALLTPQAGAFNLNTTTAAGAADPTWVNLTLPPRMVLGASEVHTCYSLSLPEQVPDNREFVGVSWASPPHPTPHSNLVTLLECPADLWFLGDVLHSSEKCEMHGTNLVTLCHVWGFMHGGSKHTSMHPPAGLTYGTAGALRAQNTVLVAQVQWALGPHHESQPVLLDSLDIALLHRQPAHGQEPAPVMGTMMGFPWSLMTTFAPFSPLTVPSQPSGPLSPLTVPSQAKGPLSSFSPLSPVIVPSQPSSLLSGHATAGHATAAAAPAGVHTLDYKCGRRCTFAPLGGLSGKPVTLRSYTVHGYAGLTAVDVRVKRCPLTRLPDAHWRAVPEPTQSGFASASGDVADVQLYPGDELSWSCTYNTTGAAGAALAATSPNHHMCVVLLHYHPRSELLRGCAAVLPELDSHNICMHEAAGFLQKIGTEANKVPLRSLVAPHAMLPFDKHPELSLCFSSTILTVCLLSVLAFLWLCHQLLLQPWMGPLHTAYARLSPSVQRNIPLYILHVVVDPLLVAWLFPTVFAGWCGCTEAILTRPPLFGLMLQYVIAAYAVELVWKLKVDRMLAVHHVCTIVGVALMAGELAAHLFRAADAAILLAMFALLEQPSNMALLLHRMMPEGSKFVLWAWRVALVLGLSLKVISLALCAWLIKRDWAFMPPIAGVLYAGLWLCFTVIQTKMGHTRMDVYRSIVKAAQLHAAKPAAAAKA